MQPTDYEGYPYITFIDKNIQAELNNRSSLDNRIRNINSWVKVTSGVQKIKATNSRTEVVYNDGRLWTLQSIMTIRSSSINNTFDEIYNAIDNRPDAGISSANIQYKSKYGGVRTAQIKWQVNSLKQFQAYAPYFLNPGRTMLVEWGWTNESSNIYELSRTEYEDLKADKSFEAWEYLNKRSIKANGLYDGMLGVVTNYDFNLREDGGFDIMTEITSQGTMMYGLNLVHQSNVSEEGKSEDEYQTTIKDFVRDELNDVVADWPIKSSRLLSLMGNKVAPDVAVYIDTSEDSHATNNKFVTWGFIEDVIVNPWIGIKFGKKGDESTGKPVFKLQSIDTSNWYVKSSSKTTGFIDTTTTQTIDAGFRSVRISNNKALKSTNLQVCFLNNGVENDATALRFDKPADDQNYTDEADTGYLRNTYVNLQVVYDAFNEADTLTDALLNILGQINIACIQYWDFNLKINEKDQTLRVIDANYTDKFLKTLIDNSQVTEDNIIKDIYLFRSYGGNGTIKGITFSSKLSNDITMTALYANNKNDTDNYIINNDTDAFRSIWNNGGVYTDYFYDVLYYETKNRNDSLKPKDTTKLTITSIKDNDNNKDFSPHMHTTFLPLSCIPGTDEINEMKKSVYGKSANENQKSNLVVPADFEMTLEGISGIRIGDVFWVDAVPDMYIENSIFQVTGVDQAIENNYWTTTIKAMLNVNNIGASATQIKSDTSRPGISIPKITQINQTIASVNPRTPNKSVVKWIKDNMGSILSSNASGLYTADILAGIMHTEASGPIFDYGVVQKMNAADVCGKIKNPDAGSMAYSFFQFNYKGVNKEYQTWIDAGRWKRPHEAAMKAVQLLKSKETYVKNSITLSGNDLFKVTIASYNQGEGRSVNQLKSGIPVDEVNPLYVANVLKAAEEYRNT